MMYSFWHKIVFVRLLLPLVMGILCQSLIDSSLLFQFFLVLFGCSFFALIVLIRFQNSFRFRFVNGYLTFFTLFALGFILAFLHQPRLPAFSTQNIKGFVATVVEEPIERLKSSKLQLEISTLFYENDTVNVQEKIVAYFAQQNDVSDIHYGDVIYVNTGLQRIAAPLNPSQFDYQKYMDGNGIFYQTFVPENDFIKLASNTRKDIMFYVIKMRTLALQTLEKLHLKDREFAIAAALIFGYQEDLDQATKNSFIKTGSMHILAVSGMHVGIIFIMITRILFFLDKKKWMRTLRFFIILFLLWFYTLLCGFSPAILRAAVMFTFILPASTWKLPSNTYNSIAASAFFLLVCNAQMLFDVGLQLSYFAVVGIVFLYPKIAQIWKPKSFIGKEFWTIVSVSLAATITTLPISLYYFGQFANSFLLANLVLVPVSAIVLYVGIAAILLAWIPYLSDVLGFLLHWSIKIMYACIAFIENLPFSYYDKLYTTGLQAILVTALIVVGVLFFQYRKAYYLKWTLGIIVVLQFTLLWRQWQIYHHQEIVVYAINNQTYVEFLNGHQAFSLYGNFPEGNNYLYSSKSYHQKSGVLDTLPLEKASVLAQNEYVNVNGVRLFQYNEKMAQKVFETPFEVDYLIISEQKKLDVEHLLAQFSFQKVILDSSIPWYKAEKWTELLNQNQIKVHNVQKDGAFQLLLTNIKR